MQPPTQQSAPTPTPQPTQKAKQPSEALRINEQPIVEHRLANMKDFMDNPGGPLEGVGEDFGEVLRHELNNPLTGILGNAELLLAEIRRTPDVRLPPGGLQRLETIATLAVRLRETIRRLSQEWELREAQLRNPLPRNRDS
jgi:signal transduction histidine kinase